MAELAAGRQASEARSGGEQTDLLQAVRDADARAEAAVRERENLAIELEAARLAAAAAAQDAQDRYDQFQTAAEKQIAGLELAARYAEVRTPATEREVARARPDDEPWELVDVEMTEEIAAKPAVAPPVVAAPVPAAPVEADATSAHKGPARAAKRITMAEHIEVHVDGDPGKLIDLSETGAQILSPTAQKPNRVVALKLQDGDNVVSCKGKIMWSRLEPTRGGQLWYRAGVSFTSSNQAALKTFLDSRAKNR